MNQEESMILDTELLKDPLGDREVNEVPLPPQVPLTV